MRWLRACASALLLAACATPPAPDADTEQAPAEPVAAAVDAAPAGASFASQPLKHLLGRNLKAMPERALDVATKCSFRDVAGGRGSMELRVRQAEVKSFVAQVSIPKQGTCRFDMKGFEQTARLPNVVLTDRQSSCVVSMWQQDKAVTVAFNSCQAKCSGDAFSYLWPILVDTSNGRCS